MAQRKASSPSTNYTESILTTTTASYWVKPRFLVLVHSVVFVDQSGFYLLPTVVRTYAPVGQTPILHHLLTYDHLSVISASTPQGKPYTMVQEGSIKGPDVVRFLKHLLRRISGKLLHRVGRGDHPPHSQGEDLSGQRCR
jgi:hypothetical protein